tara:strand:+ start:146 stop:1030 length:885 start_codon:yes stop_codon:yes gene_type:complete
MVLKKGSRGEDVKVLQQFLGLTADGIFGSGTEASVKNWQVTNGLVADGIVGPKTWDSMGAATTDNSEKIYTTENGLTIEKYFLPSDEYLSGPTEKEYCFIHHTAGWHKPKPIVDSWGRDSRGKVATEFVMGGQSVKGNDSRYDGQMIQCIPEGGYGWHLGKNGSRHMHTHSVGIEVCNFGYIKHGKTYAGTTVAESQITKLKKPFRGYVEWHRYSDEQLNQLKKWILWIAERDNIDIHKGLVEWIHKSGGHAAFEFNEDAFYGKVKGLLTHTNTRKDKFDMFPQDELIDMLVSL